MDRVREERCARHLASRAILFELPDVYEEALARYALSAEDIAFPKAHRRSHNRLGFAIQLALAGDLGRPLRAGEVPPQAVISVVAARGP